MGWWRGRRRHQCWPTGLMCEYLRQPSYCSCMDMDGGHLEKYATTTARIPRAAPHGRHDWLFRSPSKYASRCDSRLATLLSSLAAFV
jgi:hypothetical protein